MALPMFYKTENNKNKMNLDQLLEYWFVMCPGEIDADIAEGPTEWWAVGDSDRGIVAYFMEEKDAYRYRLDRINAALNS